MAHLLRIEQVDARRRERDHAAREESGGLRLSSQTNPLPRSRAERRRDTEHRLAHDVDAWVATASPDGAPHLVPLSFDWDGEALLLATPADSPTGRNLAMTRTVRVGLGHTRDVSMIEGDVEDELAGRELMRECRWLADD